jgi:hypothetical protein
MKASEFKSIATAIGVFASARETAKAPESLIGVQSRNGVVKLIAGSKHAGTTVVLSSETEGNFGYTIEARPFLQASKAITGKQEVELLVMPEGLTIKASQGGKIELKPTGLSLKEAGFPRKATNPSVVASIYAEKFQQLAKVFDAVHGDREIEAPSLEMLNGEAVFVCLSSGNRAMYAMFRVPAEGPKGYYAAAYPDFWRALKIMKDNGAIRFGEDGVLATDGTREVFVTPYRVAKYDPNTRTSEEPRNPEPWPVLVVGKDPTVRAQLDKKALIETVKGALPGDEHNRVTINVDAGTVEVRAFGAESGMTLPADTVAHGTRSVNADYLLKLLRAIDGKAVTLAWGQSPAVIISSPEMDGFTILLAPVALSGGA